MIFFITFSSPLLINKLQRLVSLPSKGGSIINMIGEETVKSCIVLFSLFQWYRFNETTYTICMTTKTFFNKFSSVVLSQKPEPRSHKFNEVLSTSVITEL